MREFRLLVAFLVGAAYASAVWTLTLPCDDCGWRGLSILIVTVGGIVLCGLVALAFIYGVEDE